MNVRDASPAFLFDRHNERYVEAQLVEGVTDDQLDFVEREWSRRHKARERELEARGDACDVPQSGHWEWRKKVEPVRGLLAYKTFALVCEEEVQGMMRVKTEGPRCLCRLPGLAGRQLAYVEYVETAPWNSRLVAERPRFGGVGLVMIRTAIEVSREEELDGRIGLHSLEQAEEFYREACGMVDLGVDPEVENLRYFEMTAAQARLLAAEERA